MKIMKGAFSGCESISNITVPSTIVKIDDCTFNLCIKLRQVVLNEGLKKIGREAFKECKALESITLPSTLTDIGNSSFYDCSVLRKVVLSDELQKMGGGAFERCSSLQSITIPSSITEISDYAFSSCTSLRDIVLNGKIKSIGDRAFYQCVSLPNITLPHIKVIGGSAFQGCRSLREVGLSEEAQEIRNTVFHHTSLQRFVFPHLSMRLEAIMQDRRWAEIRNKIDNINGVQRRGSEISLSAEAATSMMTTESRSQCSIWTLLQDRVDSIIAHISYPEMKAATTLFELALWKAKISQTDDANREACRVGVPEPVKDVILQYLWPMLATRHTLWRNG